MSLQKLNKSPKGGHFYRKQVAIGSKRTTIRLGRLSVKNAEEVSRHIDALVETKKYNTTIPAATSHWLTFADSGLVEKLARMGLCAPMANPTVAEFVERFITIKNVKPRTEIQYQLAKGHLVEYFGESRRLKSVTATDADDFYQDLLKKDYSINTVNRRAGRVREFFNEALEQGLILKNPFKKRTISVSVGAAKKQEVTEAMIHQVIEHCPTTEWKLLFAFARWIGCRIPSEIQGITWNDVDWQNNAILIRSPKTEHCGKGERLVPLFEEVRLLLDRQFHESNSGDELTYIFPTLRHHACLSTTAKKYVRKAKLPVWSRFFTTLRANRETDLMDSHGIRKACAWIGNTPGVAMKNYATQKGTDFDDHGSDQRQKKVTTKVTKHAREPARAAEPVSALTPEKHGIFAHSGALSLAADSRDRT